MPVAPATVHPAPVVALGIVALKVNCVPLAEATVCAALITMASAALQWVPFAVMPGMVTNSPMPSVLATVTVTTVVVAVTEVGLAAVGLALTCTG